MVFCIFREGNYWLEKRKVWHKFWRSFNAQLITNIKNQNDGWNKSKLVSMTIFNKIETRQIYIYQLKTGIQDTIKICMSYGVILAYSWRKQKQTPTQ